MARRASNSCSYRLMSHFWDPQTPFFASETFKIWSPKPQNRLLWGPFSGPDFERFRGEKWSFEVPKRAQNDTKVCQLLWYRADRHRRTDRQTHIKILGHCAIGPSGNKVVLAHTRFTGDGGAQSSFSSNDVDRNS